MLTPKPYLSWSSLDIFERNPKKWADVYIYKKQMPANKGMVYGKKMAEGLEDGELTGDPILDSVIINLPKLEVMDKIVEDSNGVEVEYKDPKTGLITYPKIPFLKYKKIIIPVLIKPDTAAADYKSFKEYKTGQEPWTQSRFDKLDQITYYATGIYLKTGQIPSDIEGVWVKTEKEENDAVGAKIRATGAFQVFKTGRHMGQVLNMMLRIRNGWVGMSKMCEELIKP